MLSKFWKIVLVFVAMVLSCLLVYSSGLDYQNNRNPSPPPEFSTETIDGEKLALKQFKGKVILVHFWASWCAPCKAEFPQLMALAKEYPEKIEILAISADQEKQAIVKFMDELPIEAETADRVKPKNLHLIWDKDKAISAGLYQTRNYPETYMIDHQFKLRDKVIGAEMDWEGRIASYIAGCPLGK